MLAANSQSEMDNWSAVLTRTMSGFKGAEVRHVEVTKQDVGMGAEVRPVEVTKQDIRMPKPSLGNDAEPVKLYVYLYVKAVMEMDEQMQTFKVIYHLYLQWNPSDAEWKLYDEGGADAITVPHLKPSNSLEHEDEEESRGGVPVVHVLETGGFDIWGEQVHLPEGIPRLLGISRKCKSIFSSPYNLAYFPFDLQHLHMFFESLETTRTALLFPCIMKTNVVALEIGTIASDSDFELLPPAAEFSAFGEDDCQYACFTCTLKLKRISDGTIIRIFLPCALLTLLCLSIFFIDHLDVPSRLSVLITLVLALVAFLYVISANLPAIPYLTVADKFVTGCLCYTGLLTLYSCLAGVINDVTPHVDRLCGWVALGIWVLLPVYGAFCKWWCTRKNNNLISMSYSKLLDSNIMDQVEARVDYVSSTSAAVLY